MSRAKPGGALSTEAAMAPFLAWRGCVNAWECDEMGHMNVRFYIAKWTEALAATAAAAALRGVMRADSHATIVPVDQHVRFHAEGRAGAPLSMMGGVLDVGDYDAQLFHEMQHADGRPAATFVTRVRHVDARRPEPFPWSKRGRAELERLVVEAPAHAAPRSVDVRRPPVAPGDGAKIAAGLPVIGRGMIGAIDTDAFGRARPEFFIGRISDSVPNLLNNWREETARAAAAGDGVEREPGAAVVEFRLIYRSWPKVGDLYEVRSGVAEVAEKTQRLVHWILDPATGQPWFSADAVALTFDLKTRKTITPTAQQRAALAARVVKGLLS